MFGIKMMGNVHTYAKQMQMQSMWRQKQESGDVTAKLDLLTGEAVGEGQQSVVDALTVELPEEESLAEQNKKQEIMHKIQLGMDLSDEELKYLKEKSPELYEEYMQAETERKQEEKAYRQALKQCRTREEVQRLKSSTLGRSMARAKFIANDPNIPPEKKMFRMAAEKRKTEDVERSTNEFVRKGEYKKLPTEAEVIKVMKDEAEERRAENGLSTEGVPVEEKEAVGKPEASVDVEQTENSDKPEDAERERPKIDIETETERKVRRARAKAAYAYIRDGREDRDDSGEWSLRA